MGWLQGIAKAIDLLADNTVSGLVNWLINPITDLIENSSSIKDIVSNLVDSNIAGIRGFLTDPLSSFGTALNSILDVIGLLADNVVNPIKVFLEWLFVPDIAEYNDKFQEFRSKYGFVDSVIETGEALGSAFSTSNLSDQEPPVIYIDFGAAETDYAWGGRMKILDLSWYSRYKPTVDTVLGAIMWGFFIWRVYVRLPSIISGGSGLDKLDGSSGGRNGS